MISLRLFQSDYVAFPKGKDPYQELKVYPVATGRGTIDGVRYKPATIPADKIKDLVRFLKREPLIKH